MLNIVLKKRMRKPFGSLYFIKMLKQKKGISGVVEALIMVALTIALIAVVWVVINGLVNKSVSSSQSCFGNFNKVTINSRYTCYDSAKDELRFSISVGDISVDELLISVSEQGTSSSIKLNNTLSTIPNVQPYAGGTQVKLPGKNSGLTYNLTDVFTAPDSIEIAPTIDGNQCDVADTLNQIDDCSLLA